jgi:hypothetical protein
MLDRGHSPAETPSLASLAPAASRRGRGTGWSMLRTKPISLHDWTLVSVLLASCLLAVACRKDVDPSSTCTTAIPDTFPLLGTWELTGSVSQWGPLRIPGPPVGAKWTFTRDAEWTSDMGVEFNGTYKILPGHRVVYCDTGDEFTWELTTDGMRVTRKIPLTGGFTGILTFERVTTLPADGW